MKTRTLHWIFGILAILCLIGVIILYFIAIHEIFYAYQNDNSIRSELVHWIVCLLIIIGVGIVIGALISAFVSLIPIQGRSYLNKFKVILLICFTFIFFLINLCIIYYTYFERTGLIIEELAPNYNYKSIIIPDGIDCSSIHDGTFETGYVKITRSSNIEVEVDNETDMVTNTYEVIWASDCEYYLIPENLTRDTIKVKVIRVGNGFYDCYKTGSTFPFEYPAYRIRYRKIENSK